MLNANRRLWRARSLGVCSDFGRYWKYLDFRQKNLPAGRLLIEPYRDWHALNGNIATFYFIPQEPGK